MGVTNGGVLAGQHQLITITIPAIGDAAAAAKLSADLQILIDEFNNRMAKVLLEVVSVS